MKAWIAAKRRRRRSSMVAPAAAAEVKNPLRLDDEEYLQVMKELDEVLSFSAPVSVAPAEISPL
jgi:hypothetical protein